MPFMMQIIAFALLILGMGIALWVSLWLLLGFFAIGVIAVIYVHTKQFLVEKGILNPTPGIPPQSAGEQAITIVEGDFTRVESPSKQD